MDAPQVAPEPAVAVRQPIFNVPPATLAAVVAVIVAYGALQIVPQEWREWALLYFGLIPARVAEWVAAPTLQEGLAVALTLVSHALIHLDFLHLAVNAGFLLAFGSAVERALGPRRLAVLLPLAAIGGGLATLVADWGAALLLIGASGAVSGAMGAIARLLLARPHGRRAAFGFIGAIVAINILLALVGGGLVGASGPVGWQAHLGGFAVGLLLGRPGHPNASWRPQNRENP